MTIDGAGHSHHGSNAITWDRVPTLPRAHSADGLTKRLGHGGNASKGIDDVADVLHIAPVRRYLCKTHRHMSSHFSQTCREMSVQFADMEMNDRLRAARIKRGFKSAADAARSLGIPYGTYSGHEGGSRGIKLTEIEHYARRLRVPVEWLSHGVGMMDAGKERTIPVYGHVGLGEEIEFSTEGGQVLEQADFPLLPQGGDLFALIGRGNSMTPLVEDGDIVIGDKTDGLHPSSFIGTKAIVKVLDGPYLLKTIRRGSEPERWNLESFNPMHPLRENQIIEFIWKPVAIVQRSAMRMR